MHNALSGNAGCSFVALTRLHFSWTFPRRGYTILL